MMKVMAVRAGGLHVGGQYTNPCGIWQAMGFVSKWYICRGAPPRPSPNPTLGQRAGRKRPTVGCGGIAARPASGFSRSEARSTPSHRQPHKK
jgi:hypothetical protein